jgi:hypothetical protein
VSLSSLLVIFDDLLQTAVIARSHYLVSKAAGDRDGMIEALEMAMAVDEDMISIMSDTSFVPLGLSGFPALGGTPEEILELLRKTKREQTATLVNLLHTPVDDVPELEERRADIRNRKMKEIGAFFRRARIVLKEAWDAWTPSLQREFASMLKLKAPKKKRRKK